MVLQDHQHSNKIIWFLIGNPVFTASSRIHGIAVHRELVRLGYNSNIAYLPEFIEEEIQFSFAKREYFETMVRRGDIIILQKIKSPDNLNLLRYFKKLGLRLVLIDCDLPLASEISSEVDQVICTSRSLRDKYLNKNFKASFIEDCPELYFNKHSKTRKEKLECYWFGDYTPQKWDEVVWLEELLNDKRLSKWKLITVSNHPRAAMQWTPGFLKILSSADAVALPIATKTEESSVKSGNRLLQSMALSIPVICSPLPSYTKIITAGKDAIVCSTKEDWIAAFQKLEEEEISDQIGNAAFAKAWDFRIEKTISLWTKELDLDESFKIGLQSQRSTQIQLNNFFYRLLLKKNIFYWKKMQFSLTNLLCLISSVSLKVMKRLT